MKIGCKLPVILLRLIYITLPVSEAQEVKVRPEVTGYLGHDVILPCQFIPGPKGDNITQIQWDRHTPERNKIIVSSPQFGVNVSDLFLKERVGIAGQSLTIRNVEMRDAGSYTCIIVTFPSGSFEKTTSLLVQEQMPLSSGMVSLIVIAVMLMLGIMAATVYLVFIRRRDPTVRHHVHIGGPVTGEARPTVTGRDEDVVYSDVKRKPCRDATNSPNQKNTADDVTYSEVVVLRQEPK